jgi:transposase
MQLEVEETIGDCAYGGGPTRRAFVDQQRPLTAKVPALSNRDCFPKTEFAIDLKKMEVCCPAGHTTSHYRLIGKDGGGRFSFPAATCAACPLRAQCVRGKEPRRIHIQAEEALQQQARVHNQTAAGRKSLRERVAVEHRIARLVQLGIRQSRYRGKKKTRWQVVMAAMAANVSLVVSYVNGKLGKMNPEAPTTPEVTPHNSWVNVWARWILSFRCPAPAWAHCDKLVRLRLQSPGFLGQQKHPVPG